MASLPAKRIVTLSNALVNSAQCLTLAEKRIVMMAISGIDSRKKDSWQLVTKIRALDYAETFQVDANTAYEQLKDGADQLYNRSVTIREISPKGKEIITKMHWIGRAKYHKSEGWVELAFHWEIVPHLFELKKRFTSYYLSQASGLRSIYSWRLLEMLEQFKGTGWREMDIEDFCDAMDAPPTLRNNFANLRQRVIEPAVKELGEKDNWIIKWTEIKGGRRVKGLRFEFEKEKQIQMF